MHQYFNILCIQNQQKLTSSCFLNCTDFFSLSLLLGTYLFPCKVLKMILQVLCKLLSEYLYETEVIQGETVFWLFTKHIADALFYSIDQVLPGSNSAKITLKKRGGGHLQWALQLNFESDVKSGDRLQGRALREVSNVLREPRKEAGSGVFTVVEIGQG